LKHRVSESGLGIGNVGRFDLDVWTLNGKYRLLPRSEVNPYLQAGLIHIRPGSERASAGLRAGLGTNNISMQVDSATGWSLGAGLDVWLSDTMGAFGEVSYNRVKTDAAYNVAGSDLRARSIDADPLIYRAGLMFRF
jgi:outer membrane protein